MKNKNSVSICVSIFNPIWIGEGQNDPLRGFAKYLKNSLTDFHQTL